MASFRPVLARIGLSLLFGVGSDLLGVWLVIRGSGGALILGDVLALTVLGWFLLKWADAREDVFWTGLGLSFLCGVAYLSARTIALQDDRLSANLLMRMATWGAESAIGWCVVRACLKVSGIVHQAQT